MTDLKSVLGEAVGAAFAAGGMARDLGRVTVSDRPDLADFQSNGALAAAKAAGRNPREIAAEIVERLRGDPSLLAIDIAGPGFINLRLTDAALAQRAQAIALDARSGAPLVEEQRRIMIDYGGPNVAKPMHVGHLRSSIIGESLKRLTRFLGDEVQGDAHFGDWGFQMGLLIVALGDERGLWSLMSEGDRTRSRGPSRSGRGARRPVARPPGSRLSCRRRQGQGRHRVPRPRPARHRPTAGRRRSLPRRLGAVRAGQPHRPGARVLRPRRAVRPVEGRERRRSAGPGHGRRPQGQGPAGGGPGRPDRARGQGRRQARAAAPAGGLVRGLGHVRHDRPGHHPGTAARASIRT